MHWEKMRANIHMPRSVQYPSYAFSSCLTALFLLISSFYFFNKSIAMKEREACKYLSFSLPPSSLSLSLYPSLSLSPSRWEEDEVEEED